MIDVNFRRMMDACGCMWFKYFPVSLEIDDQEVSWKRVMSTSAVADCMKFVRMCEEMLQIR